jgi:hypothetical protein
LIASYEEAKPVAGQTNDTGVTLPQGPQWYEQGIPSGLDLHTSHKAVSKKFMRGTLIQIMKEILT